MAVETDAELKRRIDEVRGKLDSEWQILDGIFKKIKNKNDEINENKRQRDEFNQLVKNLINEAKEIQKNAILSVSPLNQCMRS